ncbi:TIGR00374 family protein [Prosthecochloris sp. GSB1]|uniref:lysylphosphatidylglycerol synthase transmembrane domain-containing protein n=1 Tax=Prosthecochloris sp. GSB1 TaxID=281093 RepID=UPI000B8D1927|nr:lysylphosphatidylglycerol synthase transmembrane domain-containing protein [Prosthecochloris sp. GSB1]ASQ90893.1 TIGR00374 family protein [Prosthecochloris sp. GSB1]
MAKKSISKKKLARTIFQLAVSIIALYIVLAKTDTAKLLEVISTASPWHLLVAFLFFNLSKVLNALRLNRFFRVIGLNLTERYNLLLYYVGMFYNMFLPGGIGGDGYKIYVLQKQHGIRMLNVFNAVFWDRVAGIFALVFLTAALLPPSTFAVLHGEYIPAAYAVLALSYPLSWLLTRLLYKQFTPIFLVTSLESILIQAAQVVSAWFILLALSLPSNHIDYLAIFLVSTVATILPITVGGAGAREITFFYSLNYLGLEPNTGVALSLIFFAISAVSALVGMLFQGKSGKRMKKVKGMDEGNAG